MRIRDQAALEPYLFVRDAYLQQYRLGPPASDDPDVEIARLGVLLTSRTIENFARLTSKESGGKEQYCEQAEQHQVDSSVEGSGARREIGDHARC